jgi:hypothetical protein
MQFSKIQKLTALRAELADEKVFEHQTVHVGVLQRILSRRSPCRECIAKIKNTLSHPI